MMGGAGLGGSARRLPGFWSLVRLLESIPELGLDTYPGAGGATM